MHLLALCTDFTHLHKVKLTAQGSLALRTIPRQPLGHRHPGRRLGLAFATHSVNECIIYIHLYIYIVYIYIQYIHEIQAE